MKVWIKKEIYKRFNVSHSKSGDDIQIHKLMNYKTKGTYVDIGCWKPTKHSNTYFFYLRGWKGICVDPNPELKSIFAKVRPKDTFVNAAVSNDASPETYYQLEDALSSMNTLDYSFIKQHHLEANVKAEIIVPKISLEHLLDTHLENGCPLDFMDVDVEGLDIEVLKSNNWNKYRPKIVMVESDFSLTEDLTSQVSQYLNSKNYILLGKSIISGNLGNLFFKDILKS